MPVLYSKFFPGFLIEHVWSATSILHDIKQSKIEWQLCHLCEHMHGVLTCTVYTLTKFQYLLPVKI